MSARISAADSAARALASEAGIDPLRARHLKLARRQIRDENGFSGVTVDEAESPLAWLARRKGRDGRTLIEPVQLLAGERLRADFTRANLMPRITSNWSAAVATGPRGASPATFTENGDRRAAACPRGARCRGSGIFRSADGCLLFPQAA